MNIESQFVAAVRRVRAKQPDLELLPSALAVAARDVLFVDGVSFSLSQGDFRVPLGASDDAALIAENLQFTAGDGPCLTAIRCGAVISAPLPRLRQRWPVLADLLITRTDFRSAFSFPLTSEPEGGLAMNLFLNSADWTARGQLNDVAVVGRLVAEELPAKTLVGGDASRGEAAWQGFAGASARQLVWVAIGIVCIEHDVSVTDALARLRAHAYAEGATVDETSAWLVREPARVSELRA